MTDNSKKPPKIQLDTTRRERRKAEMLEGIRSAAAQLFAEYGCANANIEDICARADIGRSTFYNHFPTRKHLIQDLTKHFILDHIHDLLNEVCARHDDTVSRLRALIDGSITHLRNFGALERSLIKQIHKDSMENDDAASARNSHLSNLLAELIAHGQARGDVTKRFSAEYLGKMVAGTMDTIVVSWVYDNKYPLKKILGEFAESLEVLLHADIGVSGNATSPKTKIRKKLPAAN